MKVKVLEDRYEVFEDGTIWSVNRQAKNQYSSKRKLKQYKSKSGYLEVRLYDGCSYKVWLVHRIVATHFISNPYNKRTVNHKDGNKENNNVDNLEWATDSENQIHARTLGLRFTNISQIKLMNSSRRKFTVGQVEDMRYEYKNKRTPLRHIAKREGVSYSTIRDIIKGKNYVS